MMNIWKKYKRVAKPNCVKTGFLEESRFFSLVLLLVAGVLVVLATGCQKTDPVVKIGLVAPFEGRYRPIGYDVIYSARLAVREINAAGGIDGHRVALVALDDGGDPQLAYDAARALSVDPNVVAVIGHWLPETTTAAAPVYIETSLPLFPLLSAEKDADSAISAEFYDAYTSITPFGEEPGVNAYSAYTEINAIFKTMAQTAREHGTINRQTLGATIGISADS
jgi:hypothetical protein